MNNSFIIFILLGITIILVFFIYYQYKPNKVFRNKDLYSEGLDMMVSGNLHSAYNCFKDIINFDSNNINAYIKLGQVVREANNSMQALKIHRSLLLRKGLTNYQKIELYKNLALDYYKLSKLEESIQNASLILDLDKRNEWSLQHLLTIYKKNDDCEKACNILIKLHKLNGTDNSSEIGLYKIEEGKFFLELDDYSRSRELFEEALNIDDKLDLAYLLLGNSYAKERDTSYKNATIKKKENNENKYEECLNKAKQLLSKAIPMWIQFVEMSSSQSNKVINQLKDALFALNRFNEYEDILLKIIENDPDNIYVLCSLAEFYDDKGETQNAFEILDKSSEKYPNSIILKTIRLKLEIKEKGLTKSSKKMDEIINEINQRDDHPFSS